MHVLGLLDHNVEKHDNSGQPKDIPKHVPSFIMEPSRKYFFSSLNESKNSTLGNAYSAISVACGYFYSLGRKSCTIYINFFGKYLCHY